MTSKESDVSEGVEPWIVWSNEHRSFWAPNRCGYTGRIERAGRYTKAEAEAICKNANYRANSTINVGTPPEICMPAPEATLSPPLPSPPIPMLLYCPKCGLKHVDEPEEVLAWTGGAVPEPSHSEVVWENPPHRSHLCHGCGTIWRPADVPTNGVARIETTGKADTLDLNDVATLSPLPSPGVERLRVEDDAYLDADGKFAGWVRAPSDDGVLERHRQVLAKMLAGTPDYEGDDPRALHYERQRKALEAAIAALSALPLDGGGCASLSLTPSGIGEEGAA